SASMKSVIVDTSTYDWEGDQPLCRRLSDSVIYEMHVAGFTKHPNSGVSDAKRGTYLGLIEKIPYLKDLGITAVELLPVFAFDEQDAPVGRRNYWGYSPISFFAPHAAYSSKTSPAAPLDEFRDMVKAFHRAGIEVILDVVYNHTGEGNRTGPTLCFRGLDNPTYYLIDGARYSNFSGTGNTLNANHSVVLRMIQDSLRYWAQEMHVDGFRFDLASILARDERGLPLERPHALFSIETDPALVESKLIAEPWDTEMYQVGSFIGDRWQEWNGRFRDDVRAFLKGDPGMLNPLTNRLIGSPDLYGHEGREPEQSINFVTCHDGFTLNDVVSYNYKHNEANGESNQDGHDHNLSWNCGVEGPTSDPRIEKLRERQIKNFHTLTLLAVGVPMITMGDEVRRTQQGNNNAYCQDNEVSWFDWDLVQKYPGMLRFVRELIRWRTTTGPTQDRYLTLTDFLGSSRIDWHGVRLNQPDWSEHSHSLALTVSTGRGHIHAMFNAYWEPLEFELPPHHRPWRRFLDTSQDAPNDICPAPEARPVARDRYLVADRSIVMLLE
ncbi:MAG TPA: alpha-amylase family glycosyl hydrolase, partial [Polyangiaceae bacterium]|nr:alpha-amylase family glycosyl hydrolase [Polyangiaceae bacterium]